MLAKDELLPDSICEKTSYTGSLSSIAFPQTNVPIAVLIGCLQVFPAGQLLSIIRYYPILPV
jgi:hypothetical protein